MLTEAQGRMFDHAGRSDDPQALGAALADFVEVRALRATLQSVVEDSDAIAAIAKRSYRHDNGFWKIVLKETDAYKLRLHIWRSSGIERSEEKNKRANIHNHRWNFSSVILSGCYEQEIFEQTEDIVDSFPVHSYTYEPDHEKSEEHLFERGLARLRLVSRSMYTKSQQVTLSAATLHRVVTCAGVTTASLFVSGDATRSSTTVYNEHQAVILDAALEKRLTAEDVTVGLNTVLDVL